MSGPSDRGPTSHQTSSHLPGATTDDAERFESGIRNVEFRIHEICRSVQIHISNFQRSVSSAVKASLLGRPPDARRAVLRPTFTTDGQASQALSGTLVVGIERHTDSVLRFGVGHATKLFVKLSEPF